MSTYWSKEEVEVLGKMAAAGKSVGQIAKVLTSRTRHGIETKASSLGLSLGQPTPTIDFDAFKKIMGEMETPKCV